MTPRLPDRGDPERDISDPRVVVAERDPRPESYAASFVRRARNVVLLTPEPSDTPPPKW